MTLLAAAGMCAVPNTFLVYYPVAASQRGPCLWVLTNLSYAPTGCSYAASRCVCNSCPPGPSLLMGVPPHYLEVRRCDGPLPPVMDRTAARRTTRPPAQGHPYLWSTTPQPYLWE